MVEDALSKDGFLDQPKSDYALRTSGKIKVPGRGEVTLLDRKTEQAHIIYGVPSVARDDKKRFALSILSSALGGGMSSRLFQEIREKARTGIFNLCLQSTIFRQWGFIFLCWLQTRKS